MLSFNWASGGMFGALLRLNYYDVMVDHRRPVRRRLLHRLTFDYGSALLVDAEVSLNFNDRFTVTLGGENIFDEYPDDEGDANACTFLGVNYALTSPWGFNGGFYYLRLSAGF